LKYKTKIRDETTRGIVKEGEGTEHKKILPRRFLYTKLLPSGPTLPPAISYKTTLLPCHIPGHTGRVVSEVSGGYQDKVKKDTEKLSSRKKRRIHFRMVTIYNAIKTPFFLMRLLLQ
jgi:hypothetical protein